MIRLFSSDARIRKILVEVKRRTDGEPTEQKFTVIEYQAHSRPSPLFAPYDRSRKGTGEAEISGGSTAREIQEEATLTVRRQTVGAMSIKMDS